MLRVLITGCSSGFGLLSALEFSRRGHKVYATCRSGKSAAAMASEHANTPEVHWRKLDVTDENATQSIVAEIVAAAGGVDVLVNNAGVAHPGSMEDTDTVAFKRVMDTNFFGAIWTTREVLPVMRQQGSGCIIMVSSLSALVGLPGEGIYAASKAALEAAAEALRYEVDRFGIRVYVIEPGAYDTAMPAKIAASDAGPENSPYAALTAYLTTRAGRRSGKAADPKEIARLIADIAEAPPGEFRIPAGKQAQEVAAILKGLDEKTRAEFIRGVHNTEWWSLGEPPPVEKD